MRLQPLFDLIGLFAEGKHVESKWLEYNIGHVKQAGLKEEVSPNCRVGSYEAREA